MKLVTNLSLAELRRKLRTIAPLNIRKIKNGLGSFLFIEFEKSDQRGFESIWLDCCSWRFLYKDEVFHSSFCDNENPRLIFKRKALKAPKSILGISVNKNLDITISFDNGLSLECFSMSPAIYQHWHLFFSDCTITGGPGRTIEIETRALT
jgi:hypothetical protein